MNQESRDNLVKDPKTTQDARNKLVEQEIKKNSLTILLKATLFQSFNLLFHLYLFMMSLFVVQLCS